MEKSVLLFSGGFDSLLQEYQIHPHVLLYVDMKTSYSERELDALRKLPKSYQDRLIIIEFPLGAYERESKYLPYRNLILATLAMQYGQHVYFGFNASDDAPDKDDKFLKKTTSLFKHLNKNCIPDMGWDNERFSFSAPFKEMTKSAMVRANLQDGMTPEFIQGIRTCYDSESEKGCGKCRPCLNKAVALINNSIFAPELFDTPITVESISTLYKEVKERIEDGDNLPINYVNEVKRARKLLRQKEEQISTVFFSLLSR